MGASNGPYLDCLLGDATERAQCSRVVLKAECSYVYTYYLSAGKLYLHCMSGDVVSYDLVTATVEPRALASRHKSSNQFYSSYVLGNSIFLGHYPSGGLFKFDGSELQLVAPPPKSHLGGEDAREMQAIGSMGGRLYTGTWPWGELWAFAFSGNRFRSVGYHRFFSSGQEKPKAGHPHEGEVGEEYDFNELGQRVTSVIPCWLGICVATGSKNRKLVGANSIADVSDSEYGQVYYLPGPKSNCSVELASEGHYTMRFERSGRVALFSSGEAKCEFFIQRELVDRLIREAWSAKAGSKFGERNGHHGQISGFIRR